MLTFQLLLESEGVSPKDVRLLRHVPKPGLSRLSPYAAWLHHRESFEAYQATQASKDRKFFCSPLWASFVSTPARETMFVGLYEVGEPNGPVEPFDCPLTAVHHDGSDVDRYPTTLSPLLADYAGRIFIDWGGGTRTWGQYADRRGKQILELRRGEIDEPYPGHSLFLQQLSAIEALPSSWRAVLQAARGVYLLTCPRTREQYVGSACGQGGFIGRWEQHVRMEGDAVAFRSRDPSDYRVSILEVAGSLANDHDILAMEQRWKDKLQSREMGLNRN